jgi:hypothetical protein
MEKAIRTFVLWFSFLVCISSNSFFRKPLLEFKRKRLQQRKNQILFDFSATQPVELRVSALPKTPATG